MRDHTRPYAPDANATEPEDRPLVGALVVYAPIRLAAPDLDPRLGYVLPLYLDDAILLGRKKSPMVNVPGEDRTVHVSAHLLFPDTGTFLQISREHMLVEVLADARTRVVDMSASGHFAARKGEYVGGAGSPTSTSYEGRESIYLACPRLRQDTSPSALAASNSHCVQLVRFDGSGELRS